MKELKKKCSDNLSTCESKQQNFWRDLKGMNKFKKKKSYTAGNRTRDPSFASPARFPYAMGVYVDKTARSSYIKYLAV